MIRFVLPLVMVVTLVAMTGCKKEDPKPAAPSTPTKTDLPAAKTAGDAAKTAGDAAKSAADTTQADAEKLLAEVMGYIKDKKFSDAEAGLKKLGEMKNLPEALMKKIDEAKSALAAAKAMGGSAPAVPGLPR